MQGVLRQGSAIAWNDLYLISRDYIYYGLINACFYKAFSILEKRRELLDCLADHLLRYDLIRQYEIDRITQNFDALKKIVRRSRVERMVQGLADPKTQSLEEYQWRKHPVHASDCGPHRSIQGSEDRGVKDARSEGSRSRRPRELFTTLQPEVPPLKSQGLIKSGPNQVKCCLLMRDLVRKSTPVPLIHRNPQYQL